MSTVRDLITDALFSIGALGQGESLNANDAALCLRRFTRMLGTWANENLMVYTTTEGTMTLSGGTAAYSTTTLSSGRPTTVSHLFLRDSGIDYEIEIVDEGTYDAISYKASQGLPAICWYEASYPNGAFTFYPTPDKAYVAHIKGRYPLMTGTITLDTSLSLPEGYEAALCDNLAVNVAPSFGISAPAEVRQMALNGKEWLKVTNHVPLEMVPTLAATGYTPGYIRILGDT